MGEMRNIYIGDYGIMLWIPDNMEIKDVLKDELNRSIAMYGLKVVSVRKEI